MRNKFKLKKIIIIILILNRDSLAFATEPCFCSVANALGNHDNMPVPLPDEFKNFKLFEVEIKYGLMQVF